MPQPHLLPFQQNRIFTLNEPNAPRLNPALACEIGLNESVILLQLEFWIAISKNERDDMFWTYQSVRDIQATFPFWSLDTINRAIKSLEKKGFIITTTKYNPLKYDKTRWFTLNFPNLEQLESISIKGHRTRSTQNRTGSTQDHTPSMQDHTAPPIHHIDITGDKTSSAGETTTENSLKTTTTNPVAPPPTLPETTSSPPSVLLSESFKNNEEILQLIVALMVLIPEHHRQPIIKSYLQKALKAHSFDTIKAAILYTNAHSKGTTKQYRSYLGQCLDKGWADGILESLVAEKATIEETEEAKAEKIKAAMETERLEQEKRDSIKKEADEINALLKTVDVDALDHFIETKYLENMNTYSRNRWNKNQRDMFRRLYVKEFLAAESDPETEPVSPAIDVSPTISTMTPATIASPPAVTPAVAQSAPQPRKKSFSPISLIMPNILEGIRPRPTA